MELDSSKEKLATSQFRSPLLLATDDTNSNTSLGLPVQSAVLSRATSAGRLYFYSLSLDLAQADSANAWR